MARTSSSSPTSYLLVAALMFYKTQFKILNVSTKIQELGTTACKVNKFSDQFVRHCQIVCFEKGNTYTNDQILFKFCRKIKKKIECFPFPHLPIISVYFMTQEIKDDIFFFSKTVPYLKVCTPIGSSYIVNLAFDYFQFININS